MPEISVAISLSVLVTLVVNAVIKLASAVSALSSSFLSPLIAVDSSVLFTKVLSSCATVVSIASSSAVSVSMLALLAAIWERSIPFNIPSIFSTLPISALIASVIASSAASSAVFSAPS